MSFSFKLKRRSFILGASAASSGLLAAPAVFTGRAFAADKSITVTSWGGVYRETARRVLADPFTGETGIAVNFVDNGDMAKVKAQVMSNSVEWDVVDAPAGFATSGVKENLWEKLDDSLVNMGGLLQKAEPHYIPYYLYNGGLVWNAERTPDGKHPTDFASFFDVEKFPGRRCMRSLAQETLEMALVADGVSPAELYPLDVDRAFAKLDQLKPHIAKFAASTPEQVTAVSQNEVEFSYSYFNRVKAVRDSGIPLEFGFEQTNSGLEYFAVPRGAKNKEGAMQFIEFCLRPEQQSAWATAGFYAPNNMAALETMKAAGASHLANMGSPRNVIIDSGWWGDNITAVQRRYAEWMIS